ncbi:MFS transporter [Arthrobacter sp. MA-N2]|uniref:MFS transporter n=1 Tax=Arthrobacter sp. MA-N2 TaxID=1101188 RepID=UPI0004B9464F|nr:MFS transporter [Arthrobacter sp. MA-N2]
MSTHETVKTPAPPALPDASNTGAGKAHPGRSALKGGIFGYYADQFDIYLPIITLAPAMIFFQSPEMDKGTAATIAALVFASTLIARPLGSAIFGHFADKFGRHKLTLVALAGFGLATLAIAALPGYQSIGIWSVVLLVLLRFIGGVFLGGEYSTAVPLAMEWTPKKRRGLASGLITATNPLANATIAILTFTLLMMLPAGSIASPYVQWGWRIPFAIGGILAAAVFFYYLRHVEEAPGFEASAAKESPVRALFLGKHRRSLLQVFILMTGLWFLTNVAAAILPATLKNAVGVPDKTVSVIMLIASVVTIGGFLGAASLSQKLGRRRFYIAFGITSLLIASAAFIALLNTPAENLVAVTILAVVIDVFTISAFGPVAAYLTERFPAAIRASGYGIGYSFALIIPAFYTFYLSGLAVFMPIAYTPVVLIVIGALLLAVGAYLGPETRDVDMGPQAAELTNFRA